MHPCHFPLYAAITSFHLRLRFLRWFGVTRSAGITVNASCLDYVFLCCAANVTSFQMTGILKSKQNLQSSDGDASRQLLLAPFYHPILPFFFFLFFCNINKQRNLTEVARAEREHRRLNVSVGIAFFFSSPPQHERWTLPFFLFLFFNNFNTVNSYG